MQKFGTPALGLLIALVGVVWVGQGLGYIRGSFMTGSMTWFWIGLICIVFGGGLAAFGFRPKNPRSQ
ncbi:MAG: hypothetical protein NVS9B1_23470 [Candidatus Dormibacteraceae bacterium]